jgi:uncharacterized protein (UPF0335 family)
MNREPLETYDPPSEGETLEAKLAAVERAYESLLERVRRYERERAEIRTRIERILARIES